MGPYGRLTAGLLIVLGLALTGCSKTIPVGAIISESGAAASYGEEVKRGLDLAVEQINNEGGFGGKTFELFYRDDMTNPEAGKEAAEELIELQDIKVIVGAVSSPVTLAISPICEEERVVLLSPTASAPQISNAGDYIFRNYPSDILEGTAMANFARDLGLERVVIFAVNNEFGSGLRDVFVGEFKSRFRQIVQTVDFAEGEAASLGEAVKELIPLNPDGVYVAAYVGDVAEIVKAVREAGLDSVILTSSSVTDADLSQLAGAAAENLIFPQPTTFDPESDDEEVQQFIEAYTAKYDGQMPDSFAAHGYDAMMLIRLAMETGGSTHPDDVRAGLHAIKNYHGPSGRVAFEEHGDVIQYPRLHIIRQGRGVPYDRFIEEGGSLRIPGRG